MRTVGDHITVKKMSEDFRKYQMLDPLENNAGRESAAYRFSILQPVWRVLTDILKDRRLQLLESLVHSYSVTAGGAMFGSVTQVNHDETRGRIQEIDETMKILENLELEAKSR